MVQSLYQQLLGLGQAIGTFGVDGGEVVAGELVCLPVKGNRSFLIVDEIQQLAVGHVPFRMLVGQLCLQLELQNGNGLVHTGGEHAGLGVHHRIAAQCAGQEFLAGVVAVGVEGEGGQWDEVDAIALFERGKIGIAQREADHIAHAGLIARTGSHP